ncbi:TetR/AcrR family transcriptional regulator [Streptomyces sp. NPDC046887]|uniref:TetR/AcrR family transcriptional regulator n=1 Tax=Streptomyces sp. NPDC046887 TaxID=3155472 RepID=UPI00340507F3
MRASREKQAADTRAALLAAAERVFAAKGYLNTKITDITAEAGRSAGSFYNHFTGKEQLLEALLGEVAAASDAWAADEAHRADFSDPEAVRHHVSAYWRVHRAHAPTMAALRQAALVSEEFAAVLDRFRRDQSGDLAGHLAPVERLPASPGTSLALMTTVLEGLAGLWPELSEEEAVEAGTRFLYRALNGRDY